jgi:hypothetical protein
MRLSVVVVIPLCVDDQAGVLAALLRIMRVV